MEDEVVRIAKKMDKMVQKKNAVSWRAPGRSQSGPTRSQSGPGRAGPRALRVYMSVLATPAVRLGLKPSLAEEMCGCRRRLP